MNPVEKIQAAIEKLTELRAATISEPWEMEGPRIRSDGWILATVHKAGTEPTGDLIVTLRRTVDAQLVILTDALERFNTACCDKHGLYGSALALTLADAILGTLA